MSRRAEVTSTYARIGRTYLRWAPSLLLLAVIVFVPLGFLHTITARAELGSFDFSSDLELAAIVGALVALAATGLVGTLLVIGLFLTIFLAVVAWIFKSGYRLKS